MRFLIAGLGSIGRRHLRNLVSLDETDILLYRTHHSALPEEDLQAYPAFTHLEEALAQKPDAVIISNPTALHVDVALPAVRAGCALFVEKPIAYQQDDLLPLEEIMREKNNIFFSAFQFRFNPGLRKMKDLIEEKAAGRPLSFNACWGEYLPDWHPWEDYRASYAARKEMGGGVVLTLCHPLDYLRWMFGDPQELVASTGQASDLEINVEDFAEAIVHFRQNIVGTLHLDYFRRDKRQDLEIVCSEGSLYWSYDSSAVKMRLANGDEVVFPAPEGYNRNSMYLDEMSHFLRVLRGEQAPLCTFEDGSQALEFAWGILRSAQYQQRVIFG